MIWLARFAMKRFCCPEVFPRISPAILLVLLVFHATTAVRAQDPTEFKIGESSEADTYDPYTTRTSVTGLRFSALIYEPLVRMPDPAGSPEKVLVDSLYSPAPGVVRIRMAPKLLWHDSQPVTVEDVVFSYEVCKNPLFEQILNSDVRRKALFVESIKVLPEQPWLEFRLLPGLPGPPETYLTLPILPKHIFFRDGKFVPCMDPRNAIGSGPVRLFSAKPGSNLVKFKVYQQYHRAVAKLDPLFDIILDDVARMTSLSTGGVDFVAEVSPDRLSSFQGQAQTYLVIPYPSYTFESLALNFDNPLIAGHKGLRQAMMYGIDRAVILEKIYQQQGDIINGPFTPATACQSSKSNAYPFDPAKAVELLKAEKFTRGADGIWLNQGKPIQFRLISYIPTNQGQRMQVLTAIKGFLKDIGIVVDVRILNDAREWHRLVFEAEDFDITLIAWEYDPAGMVGDLFHSRGTTLAENYNFVDYVNPQVDRIIEAYEGARNRFQRAEYCSQLDKALNEELPYLFLWTTKKDAIFNVRAKEYRGIRITPLTIYDTYGEWYAKPKY